ncbi:MAG: leucine-rich repeat domain-containing protein, partial [Clostridia bacterium]|nr:leucine-rich repeat domain-containing protein [Clostridia bacterium]
MKRFLLLFVCLILAFGFSCASAEEEPIEYTSGDFAYILRKDGTAEITDYSGEADTLSIPDTIDGYSVTSIGDYAFSDCFGLTEVSIPDSVTSIVDYAFYYCFGLTEVSIPDSVTSIGDFAFSYCSGLTEVSIPDSVTSIGVNPFSYCPNLTQISVSPDHSTLTTADGVLFSKETRELICYPSALTAEQYAAPQGILSIGDYAFSECSGLTEVSIPGSVTSIGDDAFSGCKSLTEVSIPDSVTSIGDYAFSDCSGLTEVSIPDSVASIGD